MHLIQAVPGAVEPKFMAFRKAAGFGLPGPGNVTVKVGYGGNGQGLWADEDGLGRHLPHREGKQPQVIADPRPRHCDDDAAAVLRGQSGTRPIALCLTGDAAAQADVSLEGRQRKGTAAQQPGFRLRTHGNGVRPVRGQAEGKHGGDADHQRQPGKPPYDHQRQPGKPLAVGNVKYPAAKQSRQIPQSPPDHVSEAGGRGRR